MQLATNVGPHNGDSGLEYYIHDESGALHFELAGTLSDEGAKDLEQAWLTASSTIGTRKLIVDLTFVTAIGEFGRELLIRWRAEGATLLARRSGAVDLLASIPGLAQAAGSGGDRRRGRPVFYICRMFRVLAGLTVMFPISALAGDMSLARTASGESEAFARYLLSAQATCPFHTSQPVAVEVEASLPRLFKESRLIALRRTDDRGQSEYRLLQTAGDPTVTQEVIAPYLALEDRIEKLPASSVAVTPANYRFHYMGEVGSGAAAAYVFRITPRKKRDGLMGGQLWIDAATGIGVLETGHLVKTPSSFAPRIQVVRDTRLLNGVPCIRITHVSIETRRAGRAELTITEYRLASMEDEPPSSSVALGIRLGSPTRLRHPSFLPFLEEAESTPEARGVVGN